MKTWQGVGGATAHGRLVVCYVSTWAVYRPGRGSWSLDNLDATLCTHLIYAFAGLDNRTNTIRSLDEFHDLEDNYGKGTYKKMTALKNKYHHLKVSIAIGGWNEGSTNYSKMAANPASRRAFINSVSDFIRKYEFDGLDLDWEYPAKRGGDIADKQNFVQLVKELREEFDKNHWLLTAALGVAQDTIDAAYDLKALGQYLDYMHAMCYDLHGAWDRQEYAVKYLMKLGAPARKLVLGVPFYGRTFLMDHDENEILGAPAADKGFPGPYTKEDGFMGYNEVKFAMKLDLAGLMVWSIDTDDFHGDCVTGNGGVSTNYPLMKTISKTITEALQERQEHEHAHDHEHDHDHDHADHNDMDNEIIGNASDATVLATTSGLMAGAIAIQLYML
ncbi:putative chitinase 2 [Blattella germanica]|nr:putative chitinase 2 [Blattella germanica]